MEAVQCSSRFQQERNRKQRWQKDEQIVALLDKIAVGVPACDTQDCIMQSDGLKDTLNPAHLINH